MPLTPRRCAATALPILLSLLAACGGEASPHTSHAAPPTSTANASGAGNAPAVVDTGPVLLDGHAVIRPEAVGPLHVGAWRRVAMSFVYTITAFIGPDSAETMPVYGVGKDTVTIVVVNDTVSRIEVMRPGARTVDGLQVGTPVATLRARPGATMGRDGLATIVRLRALCGITFSTADSSAHSGVAKGKRALPFPPDSAVVRTIFVGKCAGR